MRAVVFTESASRADPVNVPVKKDAVCATDVKIGLVRDNNCIA